MNDLNGVDDLNEKIYRILSWVRYKDEKLAEETIAYRIYENIMLGGGDNMEVVTSGSHAEETNFNDILIDPNKQRNEISDMDLLFIFKFFYAGTKNQLRIFDALVLDNRYLELEKYYNIVKKKQLTLLFPGQDKEIFITKYSLKNSMKYHTVLKIEKNSCNAGYLRLLYTKECQTLFNIMHSRDDSVLSVFSKKNFVKRDNKLYLSSKHFKQHAVSVFYAYNSYQRTSNEGPSLDDSDNADIVPALRSPYWPNDALQMVIRKPKSGVPNNELKAKLLLKGCLMVAVGHKLSPNRDIEWRFSFSECEKELCLSWNYVQLHTYIMLKLLKKYYFNELISSYHIKTCIFWSIEWFDKSFWVKDNLLCSIESILKILIDFLMQKNLPNYFIENNNMVSHFEEEDLSVLINILQGVKRHVGQYIWENIFRGLETEPFDTSHAQFSEKNEDTYDWNYFKKRWLQMRLSSVSNDAFSSKIKFDTYMNIVPEIKKISDNVFTKQFTSMVKACNAHALLCIYLRNGVLEDRAKAEELFQSILFVNPILGQVQLALFYFVTGDIKQTLKHIYEIPTEDRELSYKELLENKGNNDMILIQDEMFLYKMLLSHDGTDKRNVWRFNTILFADYLEISCLLKSSRIYDAFLKVLEFITFLTEMLEKNVNEDFRYSGNYLYELIKKSFNLSLITLLAKPPSLFRPRSVITWSYSLCIYYCLNPK